MFSTHIRSFPSYLGEVTAAKQKRKKKRNGKTKTKLKKKREKEKVRLVGIPLKMSQEGCSNSFNSFERIHHLMKWNGFRERKKFTPTVQFVFFIN